MRGAKWGRLLGSGEIAGLRDNDVPRSYSLVFRFIAWQTKRWFFPLPYRKYVRDKKKKKKKTIFHKQTKNVAILQIKFVFFLKKYSNEIWKVIKGTGSIEYP